MSGGEGGGSPGEGGSPALPRAPSFYRRGSITSAGSMAGDTRSKFRRARANTIHNLIRDQPQLEALIERTQGNSGGGTVGTVSRGLGGVTASRGLVSQGSIDTGRLDGVPGCPGGGIVFAAEVGSCRDVREVGSFLRRRWDRAGMSGRWDRFCGGGGIVPGCPGGFFQNTIFESLPTIRENYGRWEGLEIGLLVQDSDGGGSRVRGHR